MCRERDGKMKYKLLIFDLDGTILDTLEDLTDSVNHALDEKGLPTRSIAEIKSFVGNGIHKLIERAVPRNIEEEEIEQVFKEFKVYYGIHCADKTKPYEGIEELLQELKKAGYKLAVVSNKADFAVQELCKQYFPNIFDVAVGEKAGVKRKPAPDSVLAVLEVLKIEKEQAVYIGDSEVDIATAKNAEMTEIAVTWGFREEDFLKSEGAKMIVHEPKEIMTIIL